MKSKDSDLSRFSSLVTRKGTPVRRLLENFVKRHPVMALTSYVSLVVIAGSIYILVSEPSTSAIVTLPLLPFNDESKIGLLPPDLVLAPAQAETATTSVATPPVSHVPPGKLIPSAIDARAPRAAQVSGVNSTIFEPSRIVAPRLSSLQRIGATRRADAARSAKAGIPLGGNGLGKSGAPSLAGTVATPNNQLPAGEGTVAENETTALPLALLEPSAALKFGQSQLAELERLREIFFEEVGDTTHNPADRAYVRRWQTAQMNSDELYKQRFGWQTYVRQQLEPK